MKRRGRAWSLCMLLMTMAMLVAACGTGGSTSNGTTTEGTGATNTETTSVASKNGNNIVVAVNANFTTLDPHNLSDTNSITAARTMFEGLMGFDENMQLQKVLADDYTISEDGLIYTFTLKEGVMFHDGAAFNSAAVKVNFDRILDESNNLRMRRSFTKVDSVETPDDKTVVITLKEPYAALLNKMAMLLFVSPDVLAANGDVAKTAVGTGPFKFKEWTQGDQLVVEKNETYWQAGLPKVDSVTFKPVPENGARVAMLKTGEADFIYPFPTEQVPSLGGDNSVVIDKIDSTIARYVTMNTMKKPYDDVRIRQAFNYAIDKEAYVKVVKSGLGTKLDSTMSSKTQYYSKQEGYEYDLEKAKQLLAEAGYPNGFKAEIWGSNDSETVKGMQFIQQQLALIGVELDVKPMEEATLSDQINSAATPEEATIQMWYVSWSPSSADADGATRGLFSSEMFPPAGSNTAYYKNDKVDQWIADANKSTDPAQAEAMYADIQKTVWTDAPWIFMGVDQIVSGKKPYISGLSVRPDGSISLLNAEVTQ
ncbi:Glutathione-binding protein GsiB precursor [compost metagenome]